MEWARRSLGPGRIPGAAVRALAAIALPLVAAPLAAQQESVLGTVHNLSVSGPGEIRSETERQVCKFCHVPHNAVVPQPLWGHRLSDAQYEVPEVLAGGGVRRPAPQPDGSSRLCLSCHDGTVALGDIATESEPIRMAGPNRLAPGRRGFLGTDLSGSHPVSFKLPEVDTTVESDSDMTLRKPSSIRAEGRVRLDAEGKMQCTTCHDPHSDANHEPDRVPRFWVAPTLDEVCLTCHVLR